MIPVPRGTERGLRKSRVTEIKLRKLSSSSTSTSYLQVQNNVSQEHFKTPAHLEEGPVGTPPPPQGQDIHRLHREPVLALTSADCVLDQNFTVSALVTSLECLYRDRQDEVGVLAAA